MEKMLIIGVLFLSLNSCIFDNPITCQVPYDSTDAPINELLKLTKDNNLYMLNINGISYKFYGEFFQNSGSFFRGNLKFTTTSVLPEGYKGRLWFVYKINSSYKYIKFDSYKNSSNIDNIILQDTCFSDIPDFAGFEIYNNSSKYFVGFGFSHDVAY